MTAPGFEPESICPQPHILWSYHFQAKLSLIEMLLLHAEPGAGLASLGLPARCALRPGMVTGAIWVPSQGHRRKSLWLR